MPNELTCRDVAEYFLSLVDEDSGDTITNLKLQKLVYYAQGFNLALFNKPLFKEHIEAWQHGPVTPVLYNKYKIYESNPIPKPKRLDFTKFDSKTKSLLNVIFEEYGQFSAWKLRDMSHLTPPWIKGDKILSKLITNEDLKSYFSTQIEDG